MDIVSAYKLSQTTIAHLYKIKDNDFDCIYKTSIEICEYNAFNVQNKQSKRNFSNSSNDLYNQYKQKFNNIMEVFIIELTERFNPKNYEKLVEFYECFTNCDYNKEINTEKLQSYSNLIDLNRFKCERAFVCYKLKQKNINWNNCDELCRYFQKNNLKQLNIANEIFKTEEATACVAYMVRCH